MNHNSPLRSLLLDIANEHRDLRRRLQELRHVVRESEAGPALSPRPAQVAQLLAELRAQMQSHFAEEAAGGVMEEAIARLPRLAEEASVIEREHPELLQSISEAIHLADTAGDSVENWKKVCTVVEAFVLRMLKHEAAENRLLQQGFNQDLSALV